MIPIHCITSMWDASGRLTAAPAPALRDVTLAGIKMFAKT
jgi:hypothetical protein